MAKHDTKKSKVPLREAGQGPALQHNPFAALQAVAASPSPAPDTAASVTPGAEPAAPSPGKHAQKSRGRLVLRRETKHRGGKAVVVVSGLVVHAKLSDAEIDALAQHLKQTLSCGGTVERSAKDTELVLQGDKPARVAELLRARGFRVDGVTS